MRYADLRRLLDDIGRATGRWRLVEALRVRRGGEWQAVVTDAATGLWHTLDSYTDLTAARPALPRGARPTPDPLFEDAPPRDSGRLGWGELLAVVDGVAAAGPAWELFWLGRTRRDPVCYQVYLYDATDPVYRRAHWIDTPADWARLRDGEPPAP